MKSSMGLEFSSGRAFSAYWKKQVKGARIMQWGDPTHTLAAKAPDGDTLIDTLKVSKKVRRNPAKPRTRKQVAARKRKNTVAGYYPNPKRAPAKHKVVKLRKAGKICIQSQRKDGSWITHVHAPNKKEAIEIAKAYAARFPSKSIRVFG